MVDEVDQSGSSLAPDGSIFGDDFLISSPSLPELPPQQKFGGLGALGGADHYSQEVKFRRNLLAFARKHMVTIDAGGWWYWRSLRLAAEQHPDLNINKRPRGRPASIKGGVLAMLLGGHPPQEEEQQAEDFVRKIDYANSRLEPGEKRTTDARIAQILAELDNQDTPSLIPAAKQKWAKRLSAARKRIGAQKRNRVIPK